MLACFVMVLLGGCTMSRPPISANESDPCSGSITGAQTQAFDTCIATWTTTPDQLAQVEISSQFPAGSPIGKCSLFFSYAGLAKAIPLGNMEATFFHGEIDDATKMPVVPYQAFNNPDGTKRGNAELAISGVAPIGVTDFGAVWNLHGTLTATFKTTSALLGELDVELTF